MDGCAQKNFKISETKRRCKSSYQYTDALKFTEKGAFLREQNHRVENLWRIWVDTKRRIVSFHEEEGCQMLEFRSHEMFLSCVDQYSGKQYRYQ